LDYSNQERAIESEEVKENLEKEMNEELNKNQKLNQESQAVDQEMRLLRDEEERINKTIINEKQLVLRDLEGKNEMMNSQVIKISVALIKFNQLNVMFIKHLLQLYNINQELEQFHDENFLVSYITNHMDHFQLSHFLMELNKAITNKNNNSQ